MNKHFIECWNKNKGALEDWFKSEKMNYEYKTIVKKLFELVLTPGSNRNKDFDVEKISVIDDGHYQGTQLFIIPHQVYQPDERDYVITSVNYGSCSGCDTLEGIHGYNGEKFPDEQQVMDLMMLALHLVQGAKYIFTDDDEVYQC